MLPAIGASSSTALRLRLAQDAARLGYWDCDLATGRVEWDAAPRRDSDCASPEGSTVLLYTDGLVEELGHLPLEELCDAVLAGLLEGDAEDDVALLAFRLSASEGGRVAP